MRQGRKEKQRGDKKRKEKENSKSTVLTRKVGVSRKNKQTSPSPSLFFPCFGNWVGSGGGASTQKLTILYSTQLNSIHS